MPCINFTLFMWVWNFASTVHETLLIAAVRFRSQANQCGICGEQCGTGTSFSANTSIFPCQCHSTNTPYSYFIYSSL